MKLLACVCVCVYASVHAHVHVYVYVYVYVYVCMYVCSFWGCDKFSSPRGVPLANENPRTSRKVIGDEVFVADVSYHVSLWGGGPFILELWQNFTLQRTSQKLWINCFANMSINICFFGRAPVISARSLFPKSIAKTHGKQGFLRRSLLTRINLKRDTVHFGIVARFLFGRATAKTHGLFG